MSVNNFLKDVMKLQTENIVTEFRSLFIFLENSISKFYTGQWSKIQCSSGSNPGRAGEMACQQNLSVFEKLFVVIEIFIQL